MWRWVVRLIVGLCAAVTVSSAFAQSPRAGFVGNIDLPDGVLERKGFVLIAGFAYDVRPVTRIELYVDGVHRNNATIGLPRIDAVERYGSHYPGMKDADPGFYTGFVTERFSNGRHSIWCKAYTRDGQSIDFGHRTITIDNRLKAPPSGFLDMPDPRGVARIMSVLVALAIFVSAIAARHRKEA